MTRKLTLIISLNLLLTLAALAQTTEFTYQGKLTDSSVPPTANYDFQFRLYDAVSGGTQLSSTLTRTNVAVASGIFTVQLDFDNQFTGAGRFLDISVRVAGGGAYTLLTPRSPITSSPYSVKSLTAEVAAFATNAENATNVSGGTVSGNGAGITNINGSSVTGTITTATIAGANVTGSVANAANATTATNFAGTLAGDVTGIQEATVIANNAVTTAKLANSSVTDTKIVNVAGSKITGTIPVAGVPAGSGNYIQNQNVGQVASNFNISGNGTAGGTLSGNIVNATTQYNIGGNRILGSTAGGNLFAGFGAGFSNPTGTYNSFFGSDAGVLNTTGGSNSFFGRNAGSSNISGGNNTIIGYSANVSAGSLTNATAIGANAQVSQSNSLVLGSINGVNFATADTNVGIGTTAPTQRFHVVGNGLFTGDLTVNGTLSGNIVNATTQFNIGGTRILSNAGANNLFAGMGAGNANTTGGSNSFFGLNAGLNNTTGCCNSFVGVGAGQANNTGVDNSFFGSSAGDTNTTGNNNTIIGFNADVGANNLTNATALGFNAIVNASNKVRIGNGAVTVIEGQVAMTVPSDKNLKENFLTVNGKDVLRKIRGFNLTSWNYIGQDATSFRHYGPMAQDFYAAFGKDKFGTFGTPTTINSGDMSGVMLAAIKELSTENEVMKTQISDQQRQIDLLKALVCSQNPLSEVCKQK